jgi:hypothetical protein
MQENGREERDEVESKRNGTHMGLLLQKYLIVLAQRRAKDNGCHALKAVNPLLSF